MIVDLIFGIIAVLLIWASLHVRTEFDPPKHRGKFEYPVKYRHKRDGTHVACARCATIRILPALRPIGTIMTGVIRIEPSVKGFSDSLKDRIAMQASMPVDR